MNTFKTFIEGMELTGGGQYFDPGKQRYVEQPSDEINQLTSLYPQFNTPEVQSYLELITSESYNDTVKKLARYLSINEDELHQNYPNFSSLYALVVQNVYDILAIEAEHSENLEQLAVDLVLALPEFRKIKELVRAGELNIIAKLEQPDPSGFNTEVQQDMEEDPEPGELTDDEEQTEKIFNDISQYGEPSQLARRALARTFTQGAAVNKFYLFELAKQRLGEELTNKYGIFAAIATLGYFGMPLMDLTGMENTGALIGKAEAEAGEESDTIRATGIIFPALVHELVKGIYNYLTYDMASQEQLDQEDLNRETLEMISGPKLAKYIQSMIDIDDQYLTPYIIKILLSNYTDDQIRQVLTGGNAAQRIMNQIVQQARTMDDDE